MVLAVLKSVYYSNVHCMFFPQFRVLIMRMDGGTICGYVYDIATLLMQAGTYWG